MFDTLSWILLGSMLGFTGGYICFYINQHKSEILYQLTTIKEDVVNLTIKLEQTLKAMNSKL